MCTFVWCIYILYLRYSNLKFTFQKIKKVSFFPVLYTVLPVFYFPHIRGKVTQFRKFSIKYYRQNLFKSCKNSNSALNFTCSQLHWKEDHLVNSFQNQQAAVLFQKDSSIIKDAVLRKKVSESQRYPLNFPFVTNVTRNSDIPLPFPWPVSTGTKTLV